MNQTRKIRWLIAHEPVALFLRTAEAFQAKIAELTNNAFELEIFTPTSYTEKFGKIKTHPSGNIEIDPIVNMDEGDIEMSQLHITELARWDSPNFYALELPFLFRDHDHAARVLEGKIGRGLLDSLAEQSPATALAFTYSGGFRCIASDTAVGTLDDLKGTVFGTGPNPITADTAKAIGATPNIFNIRDFVKNAGRVEGFEANALETTIPRYLALYKDKTDKRYLTNTKHSLFLTSIIVSTKFWQSLDKETQTKFQEACTYAARLERKWSVEDAENFAAKADHSDIGVTYSELNEADTEKFRNLTKPIYEKYKDFFQVGLVDGIIKA